MDDTEITNNEYRQFVYYVRDELAHKALGHFIESEDGQTEEVDWEQEIDWEDETLNDMYFQGLMLIKALKNWTVVNSFMSGSGKTGKSSPYPRH